MSDYDYDDEEYYDAEAAQAYIRFLMEKEERDRPLKEAVLTEEVLENYAFYYFDLENLEGNYIEEYGKTNNELNLESSPWAINDLFKTGKTLPGIDPRTGAYGTVIAAMGFTIAGNSYADMEEYEKAIANYTKALEINPRSIQAYLGRGVARCQLGDTEHAAYEDLWDAVDLNPLKLAEKNKQSRALLRKLDTESLQELKVCLVEALNARGTAFFKADMPNEAFEDFNEAIKHDPNNYKLYIHRGAVNRVFWHYEEAVADHTKALRLKPGLAIVHTYRAGAYIELEKYREAIADYDKKFSMVPGTAFEYINRALCYSRLHDKPNAVRDAETAIQMAPSDAEVIRCRDGIYREMEEHEKAIAKR